MNEMTYLIEAAKLIERLAGNLAALESQNPKLPHSEVLDESGDFLVRFYEYNNVD